MFPNASIFNVARLVFDLSQAQPRDGSKMDAIPATRYGTQQAVELVGSGEGPAGVDSVDQLGVKWALAAYALLAASATLMLAPAVVAVISMAGER